MGRLWHWVGLIGVLNAVVHVPVAQEEVVFVPQHGGLMGTSEAPRCFVQVFKKPVDLWSISPMMQGPLLVWGPSLFDQQIDVSLCSFVDGLV